MNNFRYDSRYDSYYKLAISETVEYILSKNYGDTISFETVGKLMHYNLEDEHEYRKFRSSMQRVKNFLVDYGYILKTITGVGYYILKPKQISGYCYHTYIRKTNNLLEKSIRILTHTDKTELSEIRKEEHENIQNLNEDLIQTTWGTIESSAYYSRKSYYDSLED